MLQEFELIHSCFAFLKCLDNFVGWWVSGGGGCVCVWFFVCFVGLFGVFFFFFKENLKDLLLF